jgi:hypothetical protein
VTGHVDAAAGMVIGLLRFRVACIPCGFLRYMPAGLHWIDRGWQELQNAP